MFSPIIKVRTKDYSGPQVTWEQFNTPEEAKTFGKNKYGNKYFGVKDLDYELDIETLIVSDDYLNYISQK